MRERCDAMVDPKKRRYMHISLAVFTAISMSLVLFFGALAVMLYRRKTGKAEERPLIGGKQRLG